MVRAVPRLSLAARRRLAADLEVLYKRGIYTFAEYRKAYELHNLGSIQDVAHVCKSTEDEPCPICVAQTRHNRRDQHTYYHTLRPTLAIKHADSKTIRREQIPDSHFSTDYVGRKAAKQQADLQPVAIPCLPDWMVGE